VYSLAILLKEYLEKHRIRTDIQFFATDIDKTALNTARTGIYPNNIEIDVPQKLLSKYFEKRDSTYQVHKDLRDMIVFAEHSTIKDPPFSRLHLISCRNLLIYLEPSIQKHLMNVFHYALLPQGYLFLGNSESQSIKDDLFITIDRKEKIFQKKNNPKVITEYLSHTRSQGDQEKLTETKFRTERKRVTIREFAEKKALTGYMHPFLITDKRGDIQYSLGKCDNYFAFHVGEPNQNILNVAREGLKIPLSNALRKVNSEWRRTEVQNIKVHISNRSEHVDLVITPILKPAAFKGLLIVTIEPSLALLDLPDNQLYDQQKDTAEYIRQLELELEETHEYLNNVIEELETSNEELKSANEEAQSTNEELQSTNEELETSKEEMQSLNEELETSNTELIRKIDEVTSINNDLNNFLRSTQIGTLFLDKNMKVKRFTPEIKNIVNLQDSDIGRSIKDFGVNFLDQNFFSDISKVLEKLAPVEKEISKGKDDIYWMRILPYRTFDDKIDGVVITFTNVTEKYRIQRIIKESEKWKKYKQLFEQMDNGFALFEVIRNTSDKVVDFKLIEANHAYEELMEVEISQLKNKKVSQLSHFDSFYQDFKKAGKSALTGKSIREDRYFPSIEKYFRILYFTHEENSFAMLIQDITEVSKELKAQHHLASIIESTKDAIYSVSAKGIILTWNDGAAKFYGFSAEDITGKSCFEYIANAGKEKNTSFRNNILKGKDAKNFESVHRKKDGTTIPVSVTISPVMDSNGGIVAYSYIVKDISNLKEREKELMKAKQETEQAANLKATFLANMSHEIRTPLNSILGFTEILKDELENDQHKHQLDTIYQSGIQLLHLINDIVDISRIDASELRLSITDINLVDVLKEIKNQVEGYAIRQKKSNIDLRLRIPNESDNLVIKSDEYRLHQIFHNLLSNAFKYTEEGFIEFGFEELRKPGEIVFFVRDTGIGINKKDGETIFERFKQGEQTSRNVVKGTGLGLAISKALAELLGGKMWLESEKGIGSIFFFTIKLEKSKDIIPHKKMRESAMDISPQFPGKKILLAEDDFYSTEIIQFMLKDTNAELFTADDGAQALDLFYKINPDLVLLDIRLPKMDGNKIITKIREKNPDIPVIAQSAYAMPEEIQKSKKKGFTEYLTKPISQNQLYTILETYLTKKNGNEE
ncbi:MAG TPA: CheR family methyltransferase, partial [Bacteroidales bacterium]|nr:CheR family methyltransferase [Bacteroidales bacterium]